MTYVPDLCDRCNSWVITYRGKAVKETWDRAHVDAVADRAFPGVVIYTALQWLQHINAQIAAQN